MNDIANTGDTVDVTVETPQKYPKEKRRHEHWITLTGFCLLGIMNNFSYVIGVSAAMDLVESHFPKSVVLLCDILPGAIISSILPQWHQYIKLKWVCLIISLIGVFGYIIAGLSKNHGYGLGLAGVVCFSIQVGIESPTLSHSGKFLPDASYWFCIGMGIAGIVGTGAYALLTETLKIPYDTVLYAFSPIPLIANLGSWFTYIKPSQKLLMEQEQIQESQLNSTSVSTATADLENDLEEQQAPIVTADEINLEHSSWKDKGAALLYNWLGLVSLLLVYLFYYTTTTGVNPTLKIANSATAFYKWAAFSQRIGNFVGRFSVLLFYSPYWTMLLYMVIVFLIFMLFSLESGLRFINNGIVLICIMPIMGFCSGIIYSDTMFWIQARNSHENPRSYALGIAGMLTDYGVIFATFLGTGMELWLKSIHPEDWQ